MLHLPCSRAPPLWGINMYIFCVNVRVPVQRSLGMRSNVVNISNESRSRVHGWWLNNIYLTAWPDRVWLEFNFWVTCNFAFDFTGLFCVRHCSYVSRAYIAYWTPLTLSFTLFLCPNIPAISASASTDRWLVEYYSQLWLLAMYRIFCGDSKKSLKCSMNKGNWYL